MGGSMPCTILINCVPNVYTVVCHVIHFIILLYECVIYIVWDVMYEHMTPKIIRVCVTASVSFKDLSYL